MRIKKNLFITLLLIFLLAAASGCSQQEPAKQGEDTQEEDTQIAPADTNQDTTDIAPDSAGTEIETSQKNDENKEISDEPEVDDLDCKAVGFEYDDDDIDYKLVWSDEFDYTGLPDDSKWGYDTGGNGWGNNELQYYTEGDNVWVEDGLLTITARKEAYGKNDYTSTRLITKNKGDWMYGRIEVRAKLPEGRGTWPAIWMLPTDWVYGGWPRSGEIDIMEHVGYEQGVIHATIHTSSYNHMKGTQIGNKLTRADASETFYTYSVEWYPDKMKFFIDDKLYFYYKPSNLINCPDEGEWPFDQRFHLLLNIAVGGDWGGARGIDDTIFPQEMKVDYVRVYQAEAFDQYRE